MSGTGAGLCLCLDNLAYFGAAWRRHLSGPSQAPPWVASGESTCMESVPSGQDAGLWGALGGWQGREPQVRQPRPPQ